MYNGEKIVSLINSAGKTGCYMQKNETGQLCHHIQKQIQNGLKTKNVNA